MCFLNRRLQPNKKYSLKFEVLQIKDGDSLEFGIVPMVTNNKYEFHLSQKEFGFAFSNNSQQGFYKYYCSHTGYGRAMAAGEQIEMIVDTSKGTLSYCI